MQPLVALGAAAWDWPEWNDAFYPSDLPEEWRLTYYNTQFSCVFLAEPAWRQAGAAAYEAWATATHGQFVFLLEGARAEEVPRALVGRAHGVTQSDSDLLWFDRATSLKTLAGQLASAYGTQLYLLSRDGALGQIERVRTLLLVMGR